MNWHRGDSPAPYAGRNLPASVRERLLRLARERGEDFNLLLNRYGVERLLYRLSRSPLKDRFVLKGATLFALWSREPYRPTRDLDLLGFGDEDPRALVASFRDLCELTVEADGLTLLPESVSGEAIREDAVYAGVRIRLLALLEEARIQLQIDIGFGDVVTPSPVEEDYPALLDFPPPRLRVYPRETVVAEKYQAMVALGRLNSRMKDFHDLWTLSREFEFSGETLCQAIQSTFLRRETPLPEGLPIALSDAFSQDEFQRQQWAAYSKRGAFTDPLPPLEEIVPTLRSFLWPPTQAIAMLDGLPFARVWKPGGLWDISK